MTKWIFPRIIAHRGGGILAPENTIRAIEVGMKFGFKAIEFDVMLSKDSVPFLMHDEILSRTVGSGVHREKLLCDLDSSELIQIDAGSWFDVSITDVKIPLFEDVIKFCVSNNVWMNIEIKPAEGFDIITGQVVAELTNTYFPIHSESTSPLPLFSSFSYEALLSAKQRAPHIPRGYLIESLRHTPQWKEQMVSLQAIAVHTDHKYLTAEDVTEIKACGYGLFCYTVNDLARAAELTAMGVDAFCTDKLDLFDSSAVAKGAV
jgi:glycerophosphoryl diester phosphodiesterase